MGGGKSQKGGNHGSIGRTLAHDILLRQSQKNEQLNRLNKKKEYSVYERSNLEDFTMAATQGLESYIAKRGVTREVKKTDLNSQLYEFINYPHILDDSQFPLIPIPRRSFLFTDEQKQVLAQLNKQRLLELRSKNRRYYRRKNKKKVDMYMHGDVSKPYHGYYNKYTPNTVAATANTSAQSSINTGRVNTDRTDTDLARLSRYNISISSTRGSQSSNPKNDKHSTKLAASTNQYEDSDDDLTISDELDTESDGLIVGSDHAQCPSDLLDESDEDVDSQNDYQQSVSDDDQGSDISSIASETSLASDDAVLDTSTASVDDSTPLSANGDSTPQNRKYKYVDEYLAFLKNEYSNIDLSTLTTEDLDKMELTNFYKWRSLLNNLEATENSVLTPYEKNIEFWRQLWRVIEKSNLVLIVLDSRDPLFFRIKDLERYIKEIDKTKQFLLVLNKADFLNESLRIQWAKYFKGKNIDCLFFSSVYNASCNSDSNQETGVASEDASATSNDASIDLSDLHNSVEGLDYRIYNVELLLNKINRYKSRYYEMCRRSNTTDSSCSADSNDSADFNDGFDHFSNNRQPDQFFVGFVGYPNVGKSSLINCLMEKTKVSVGVQPGKTKHMQTLKLHDTDITLCDCPGLIFPNMVSTKYHLLINNIVSTSHFKGNMILAVQLICNLIPIQLCNKYDININDCLIATNMSNTSRPLGRDNVAYGSANHSFSAGDNSDELDPDSALLEQLRTRQKVVFSVKLLELLCKNRGYISGGKGGQLDYTRASKLIINDFTQGNLLYCKSPPTAKASFDDLYATGLCLDLNRLNIGGVQAPNHPKQSYSVDSSDITSSRLNFTTQPDNRFITLSTANNSLDVVSNRGLDSFSSNTSGVRYLGKTITESKKDEENVNQWLKQQIDQENSIKVTKRKMRFLLKGKRKSK